MTIGGFRGGTSGWSITVRRLDGDIPTVILWSAVQSRHPCQNDVHWTGTWTSER